MNRIIAFLTLLFTSPILLLLGIGIGLDSAGKIIYTQWRNGEKNREFRIYKFRTMGVDSGSSLQLAVKNDPRITRIGKYMRKYRLDEIPQLWNICRGEMNWFGVRPEQAYYVNRICSYSPLFAPLFRSKPGLMSLGVAQVGYATRLDQMVERAKWDRYFRQHDSFALRLYVLCSSFRMSLTGKGH